MFDPKNVRKYIWESRGQGDPGAVVVMAADYNKLLKLYEEATEVRSAGGVEFARLMSVEEANKYLNSLEPPENGNCPHTYATLAGRPSPDGYIELWICPACLARFSEDPRKTKEGWDD